MLAALTLGLLTTIVRCSIAQADNHLKGTTGTAMSTTRSTATSTFEEVKVTPLFLVCLSLTHASLYTAWGFAYQFMFGLPWWFVLLTMYTM